MIFDSTLLKRALTLALAVSLNSAYAVDEGPGEEPKPPLREEIVRMLDQKLPGAVGSPELVELMLSARLGPPIRDNLDLRRSLTEIFGRRRPIMDPDCRRTSTASGDPASDRCTASSGDQNGAGEYTAFSWSKDLNRGDVKFFRRLGDGSVMPEKLPDEFPMSDAEAYGMALDWLSKIMGVPPEEIPEAPTNAPNPMPIRTLAVGEMDPTGKGRQIPVAKVLLVRRGLKIDGLAEGGRSLPYLAGPGLVHVLIGLSPNPDGALKPQVMLASVRNWRALERSAMIDSKHTKTRTALLEEIADMTLQQAASPIHSIGVNLEIVPLVTLKPETKEVAGIMVPSIEISVATAPRDPTEEEQERLGPETAGFQQSFALVEIPEGRGGDDD